MGQTGSDPATIGARGLAIATVALAVVVFALDLLPHRSGPSTSFSGYWLVARELSAGTDAALFYDEVWLNERLAAHGLPADRMLGPPALALTLLPLAGLPHDGARAVWLGVQLLCLLGSLVLLARRLPQGTALLLMAAFALGRPTGANMEVAQVYGLFLLLHVLALEGWRRRAAPSALWLSPLLLLRGWHGLPQAVGWLVAGRPAGALWAGLGLGLGLLLSLPLLGLESWRRFAEQVRTLPEEAGTAGALAYQTWRSLSLRLSVVGPDLPDPALPGAHPWLFLGGAALILALTAFAARRLDAPGSGLPFAAWTTLALLLAPFAEDHHFLLAAIPAFVLVEEAPRQRWLVAAALLFLLPAWPYDQSELWGGWRCLAGYPRVWGMGLLLLAFVREARRRLPGTRRHLRVTDRPWPASTPLSARVVSSTSS